MKKLSLLRISAALFAFLILLTTAFSQKTGSYNRTITFNGESRVISLYVPTDYNPANKYQLMVCLHGLGDNSTNFRSALINSLRWNTIFQNTIFACPDGGSDQGKDFYSPPGDEEIIPTTIAFVRDTFNIDTTKIILEGFSLGGRSALKYGLDNPTKFKSLLLNTPAIQGPLDGSNVPGFSLMFNYENASKIPIAITVGDQDLFAYIIPLMYDKLVDNDCKVLYVEVPGMGHDIPSQDYTGQCRQFLENPPANQYDVELRNIDVPERTCSSSLIPKCKFRNLGSETITSVNYSFNINGVSNDYNWSGNLLPFHNAVLETPELTLRDGTNNFTFTIKDLNNDNKDTISANDTITGFCRMYGTRNSLPLVEGFEDTLNFPALDWFVKSSGNLFSWSQDNNMKKSGLYSMSMFNSAQLFYTGGMAEELYTPIVNLTTIEKPTLSFDLAFNYLHYTPPQVQVERDFTDTLEISISKDCGATYEIIYRKSGAALATAKAPILNAQNIQGEMFFPSDDEWRNDAIDLSNYSSQDNVSFRFNYISGMGGTFYIDNISIAKAEPVDVRDGIGVTPGIYPNPASDYIELHGIESSSSEPISILSLEGVKVMETSSTNRIDISKLSSGIYFVNYSGKSYKFVKM